MSVNGRVESMRSHMKTTAEASPYGFFRFAFAGYTPPPGASGPEWQLRFTIAPVIPLPWKK
jgi:hypothetical protein